MFEKIEEELKKQQGHVGFYYKNLVTGEEYGYKEEETFLPASVIKLPVFMWIERLASEGTLSLSEKIHVKESDKLPICGALTLFTGELDVDILTLCKLMISISDNAATNLLIKRIGIEELNQGFAEMGLSTTRIKRLLFDSEGAKKGLENAISPKEMGMLLEQVYRRTFVNEEVSKAVEDVLFLQQINHKICGRMSEDVPVAHKTGEDDNLTNDVGIVYAKKPFIVCFTGYDTCVAEFEDFIRRVSHELLLENNK